MVEIELCKSLSKITFPNDIVSVVAEERENRPPVGSIILTLVFNAEKLLERIPPTAKPPPEPKAL